MTKVNGIKILMPGIKIPKLKPIYRCNDFNISKAASMVLLTDFPAFPDRLHQIKLLILNSFRSLRLMQ